MTLSSSDLLTNDLLTSNGQIIKAWNDGIHGLDSKVWKDARELLGKIRTIDLNAISESDQAQALIEKIDRRDLYVALKACDEETAVEIMPLLTQEQFTAIIDYESWEQGRLAPHQMVHWLEMYKHQGLDAMFKRFKELDEEYQIAMLAPYIEVLDEDEFEKTPQDLQDKFKALPCNTLWYRVKGDDSVIEEFVFALVEGGLGEDLTYIYSLLQHAMFVPPNEDEERIRQFRNARLEEDGFVSDEEAFSYYDQVSSLQMKAKWLQDNASDKLHGRELSALSDDSYLLDRAMRFIETSAHFDQSVYENTYRSLISLCNAVSSVNKIGPDDLDSIGRMMLQVHGMVNVALEWLCGDDVTLASQVLVTEYPKKLFAVALDLVHTPRLEALEALSETVGNVALELKDLYAQRKFGALLWRIDTTLLDKLGFEVCEVLKGLFNRHPMVMTEISSSGSTAKKAIFEPIRSLQDLKSLNEVASLIRRQTQSNKLELN